MSNAMPFVKWHGRDWLGDPLLRMVSPEVRGVWIDLLCAMMNAEPYGHLAVNGNPMTDEQAARLIGIDIGTYKGILSEIEGSGISSRNDDGLLFSRRLVRDYDKFTTASKFGKMGGGNPRLSKTKKNPEPRTKNPEARGTIKDSFIGTFKGKEAFDSACDTLTPKLTELAEKWMQYKSERKEKYTPSGLTQVLKKMVEMGEGRTEAAINFSMESNYAGMFEPKQSDAFARSARTPAQPRADVDPSLRTPGYGKAITPESLYGGDDE